ncbi:MAG TPA: TldD/PmbA family protein [Geminicoccaceae bacterium]|mgnify:CR=1 FL=1|nr:TldD/PmbA family protein [Geminicoccus sp.]HMU51279.1 TldD/PmbA family protein [Geminicoccaceae bacterium]
MSADGDASHLLDLALDVARTAGADVADLLLVERRSLDVSWRMGDLEELERKEDRDLGLRLFVGRRQACASTSQLDPDALAAFVRELVESARHLPEDPFAGLAEPGQLAKELPELDLFDPDEPAPDELLQAAAAAEDAARAVNGVSNSDGASAGWSTAAVHLAASNGLEARYRRTAHRLGVTVLAGSGTQMERDREHRSASHRGDLPPPAEIGRTAGERTVRRLGPRKAATAAVPVVYDPRVASSLVRHLVGAISGEAIAKGTSFLKDCLGDAIMSPGVVIIDDPLRRRGLASRPIDAEGLPVATRRLVDAGMLTTWLLDLSTARQLGLRSTGHAARGTGGPPSPSATNLTLGPGRASPAELIGDIRSGLYVTDLMGMGVNMLTGDYSRGAAGFWIEGGELKWPVSEVTIAGNLKDMLAVLQPADDLDVTGSCDAPTVRIDGMTVAGR